MNDSKQPRANTPVIGIQGWAGQLRLFLVAVQFYSRLPVRGRLAAWMGFDASWLAPATRYFTAVGILVGLIGALIFVIALKVLPSAPAVVLMMIAAVLMTGAFHEDGFADFCDGFGATSGSPLNDPVAASRTLEIMKDSRLGAYGVFGAGLMLLLRFSCLTALVQLIGLVSSQSLWLLVLVLISACAWSRACAVIVMATLPYARADLEVGKAKPIAQSVRRFDLAVAMVIGSAPCLILFVSLALMSRASANGFTMLAWSMTWVPIGLTLLATWILRRMMLRRLNGYTGDCLGAVQIATEQVFLIGVLIALTTFGTSSIVLR
jgi:adenosylcobinamide-GDP ribazoletransferase